MDRVMSAQRVMEIMTGKDFWTRKIIRIIWEDFLNDAVSQTPPKIY